MTWKPFEQFFFIRLHRDFSFHNVDIEINFIKIKSTIIVQINVIIII